MSVKGNGVFTFLFWFYHSTIVYAVTGRLRRQEETFLSQECKGLRPLHSCGGDIIGNTLTLVEDYRTPHSCG